MPRQPVLLRHGPGKSARAGARAAAPGEFTKRAFLNGKLDLVQAEAICDADISADAEEGNAGDGSDSAAAYPSIWTTVRQKLVAIKAHLEARIDFAEEDDRGRLAPRCRGRYVT